MTKAPVNSSVVSLADLPGRPCPIAASLELVGERWSLLVVRELSLGSHRFTDIVAGTGAPRDRIAARLKALVEVGVVERRQYQSAPERFEYHLTDSGLALLPALDALLVWGRTYAVAPDDPDLDRHRRIGRRTNHTHPGNPDPHHQEIR
ncbi:MAG: helix-turn-helix domain-containing protein [Marmoricola sp.]